MSWISNRIVLTLRRTFKQPHRSPKNPQDVRYSCFFSTFNMSNMHELLSRSNLATPNDQSHIIHKFFSSTCLLPCFQCNLFMHCLLCWTHFCNDTHFVGLLWWLLSTSTTWTISKTRYSWYTTLDVISICIWHGFTYMTVPLIVITMYPYIHICTCPLSDD